MIQAAHAAARERGELASLLYASEFPIYSRFGYGPAVQTATWLVDVSATGFHDAAGGRSGTVDFLAPDDSAVPVLQDVYEGWRVRQPGEIWRRPITWRSDLGLTGSGWGEAWKGFVIVHRDDTGAVDAFARYHVDQKWEHRQPRNVLIVDDLHGRSDEAEVALWRFLAAIDLVTTVKAERRHPADRLPWLLTNGRAAEPFEPGDGMWVKLHDIPAMLEARGYERSGSIVLEAIVRDEPDDATVERRVRV